MTPVMSSALSPDQFGSNRSYGSPEGTTSSQNQNVGSPLDLEILKSVAEKRSAQDGNTPRRRGPKPDSKPALTRRQELNRQAQRTHRERKELYIKALEDEVLRLKEVYSHASQSMDRLAAENKQLKSLLGQHGIPCPKMGDYDDGSSPGAGTSLGNRAALGSYSSFSPGSQSGASTGAWTNFESMSGYHQVRGASQQLSDNGADLEQAGIDFVLTLEKPCMKHLPFLTDRSEEGYSCGHALMATCPPVSFNKLTPNAAFGPSHTHDYGDGTNPGQGTWEISQGDLSTLLDLSHNLDLDGEITPVMAWRMILNHPRFADFKVDDFARMAAELGRKVRCYGFGAVMEEFELRDAFESVLSCYPRTAVSAH